MEQEKLTIFASNIYEFKEALKKLTCVFIKYQNEGSVSKQCLIHESLSEVLHILKYQLEIYPGLQSTELLVKAHNLIKHVQNYTIRENSQQSYSFIDQLATAFSLRVSEYLVEDLDIDILSSTKQTDVPGPSSVKVMQHSTLMTTFGVELEQQLIISGTPVPFIVTKCVKEIDERGIHVKGIYRVSGVKSKVERLCQEFERFGEKVKLNGVHPNIIANVLKLYLRQLPQPLFTFYLYSEFMRLAKDWPCGSTKEPVNAIEELRKIMTKLPKTYYSTVKVIMEHLKKVSDKNEINNMSPSNLGIVFGPTLLRTANKHSSIDSLADTVYQSRAIELVIIWANELFIT